MRAVAVSHFGGPEVLELLDLPDPRRTQGQVLVRVAAAAVNPTDVLLRRGGQAERLQAFSPPHILGMDLAGTVVDADPLSRWRIGQRVMGAVTAWRAEGGAQAERVLVPDDSLAEVPAGLDFPAAATVPMSALTARAALDLLDLGPGRTLLVTGAAGAVGGFAVEMARASGLRVVALATETDRELLHRLGADAFAPRDDRPAAAAVDAAGGRVDGVLDAANLGAAILPALRDEGVFARVRPTDAQPERGIDVMDVFVPDRLRGCAALLAEIAEMCSRGELTPRVAAVLPLEEIGRAHAMLEAGGTRGRPVLRLT